MDFLEHIFLAISNSVQITNGVKCFQKFCKQSVLLSSVNKLFSY